MNLILLSGGSGQRLWPLSNNVRSKQFVPLLRNEAGDYESMVQRVYRQITAQDPDANIVVATGKRQVSTILNQLGDKVDVCVEPCRRDTFPAIVLACAYLADVKGIGLDEPVVVCPVDPYVDDAYFAAVHRLSTLAGAPDAAHLTLMGVEPTYPSAKFGYIIPRTADPLSPVESFREKPDEATAAAYISRGALWNCGVFAFTLRYLLGAAHARMQFTGYADLREHYADQTKISFDYAVAEQEPDIAVMRFAGEWKDVGTWNTFTEVMADPAIGKVLMDDTCHNTNVVNQLNLPMIVMGCRDMVIAASSDGILVSDKQRSSHIKPFVEQVEGEARFAEKSWGSFTVLDVQPEATTIRIVLNPGHRLTYHSHEHRDEVWTIVAGTGRTVIDGVVRRVHPGDVVTMPAGAKHTLIADTALQVVEVQIGAEINVADKTKFDLEL
ncbi:MAG: sugar phosphate nucleotidyltransferase [Gemmiger sp.]|uniref:sugar phosphate nucleotidyltransferase n=1 Tax=Gemmiger sp. TaxID=2049027 RepID=UPI002E76691D|nr:sugar phosphate nucleotidyltransferase [Gemmiger sp.]MEE0800693.1 sugar phosphate nucleotidyltransferase [Gemmiger sp.]